MPFDKLAGYFFITLFRFYPLGNHGLVAHKKNEMGQTEYLSIVVATLHRRSIHIEGFHLLGEARVLVRTQSIVEPVSKN